MTSLLSRVPVAKSNRDLGHLTWLWEDEGGCPLPRLWLDEEPRSLGKAVFLSLLVNFSNCLCLSLEQSEVWKTQNPICYKKYKWLHLLGTQQLFPWGCLYSKLYFWIVSLTWLQIMARPCRSNPFCMCFSLSQHHQEHTGIIGNQIPRGPSNSRWSKEGKGSYSTAFCPGHELHLLELGVLCHVIHFIVKIPGDT